MNITKRIDALADRIEAQKYLTLHEVKSQPRLSAAAITQLEHDFGVTLPQPLRDVYSEANGFLLRWTMRPDLRGLTRVVGKDAQYELNPKSANLEYPEAIVSRFLEVIPTCQRLNCNALTFSPMQRPCSRPRSTAVRK